MFCPHCGAANVETSARCVSCGAIFLPDTPAWQAAQRGYADLTARYARGGLDAAAFQNAHATLAVRDAAGRTWLPSGDPERPYLWDGSTWTPQAVARVALGPPPAPGGVAAAYVPPPAPASYAQQAYAPPVEQSARGTAPHSEPPPPRKRHRLRGCCLGTLLILVLLAAAAVWVSPLPEQWGLRKSAAEQAFGANPEPDRGAAVELEAEMQDAGIDTTGLYAYVLPYQDGRPGGALYAVLDGSQGFRFPEAGDQDPVLAYMANLANSPALAAAGVDRIAIDYRDGSGNQVVAMTAPVASIQAFARGEITREAFFQDLEAQIDLTSMIEGFVP